MKKILIAALIILIAHDLSWAACDPPAPVTTGDWRMTVTKCQTKAECETWYAGNQIDCPDPGYHGTGSYPSGLLYWFNYDKCSGEGAPYTSDLHYWCPSEDTDGDGLKDECDPFPNNAEPFNWKTVVRYKNSSGDVVGVLLKTDGNNYIAYGDTSNTGINNKELNISSAWKDFNEFKTVYGNCNLDKTEAQKPEELVEVKKPDHTDMNSGEQSASGDSDSELVRKTADNTKKGNDIANKTNEHLVGLRRDMQDLKEGIANINNEDLIEYFDGQKGPINTEFGKVGDIDAQVAAATDAKETEYNSKYQDFINANETGADGYTSKGRELKSLFNNFFNSGNPLKSAVNNSGIQTSGAKCSDSFQMYGKTISFSFCNYATYLQTLGQLLIALAYLRSLFWILGREN